MTLIAYWPLDETSGSTVTDYSGNNNDGSINGATPNGGNGFIGRPSMSFNRSNNDEVDTGIRTVSAPLTLSCWIKPYDTNRGEFFGNRNGGGSYDTYLGHSNSNAGEVYFTIDQATNVTTASGTVSADNWHHVVAISTPNSMKLIIDGNLEASAGNGASLGDSGYNHLIGNRPDNPSFAFDGEITDFRIYSHELTDQEIQYLYSVGKRGLHVSNKRTL